MNIFDTFVSKVGFLETVITDMKVFAMRFRKIYGGSKRRLEAEMAVFKIPVEGKYQCCSNRFDSGSAIMIGEGTGIRYDICTAFELFAIKSLRFVDGIYSNVYKADHKVRGVKVKRYGVSDEEMDVGFVFDILDIPKFAVFHEDTETIVESISKLYFRERCVVELNNGYLKLDYDNADIVR
jgi:hypothetical protein